VQPELHPWNEGFEWKSASPARLRRLTPEQARAFDAQGFAVLEDAFDPAEVAAVTAEIDPWEEKVSAFLRTRDDGRLFIADVQAITFTTHLVLRSERIRDFCRGPVFRDLGADLIGPDVRLYWDQAVYKKPRSEKVFPWHQDNGYTYVEPQQYLTCWIALTDATLDNGCPWVIPGAHRAGTLRHWMTEAGWQCVEDAPEAVALPLRAGSVALFSSLTPHRTGPNRTDRVRKAYIVQLAPDGAVAWREEGGRRVAQIQDDPARQFPILWGGRALE
jgi:phytanoyl-CoA hydroxylase